MLWHLPLFLPFLLSLSLGFGLFLHLSLTLPFIVFSLLHLLLFDLKVSNEFRQRVVKQLIALKGEKQVNTGLQSAVYIS